MNSTDEMEWPDPHFGTAKEMLAWCKEEGLEPVKDADGHWDWHAVWEAYLERPEKEGE